MAEAPPPIPQPTPTPVPLASHSHTTLWILGAVTLIVAVFVGGYFYLSLKDASTEISQTPLPPISPDDEHAYSEIYRSYSNIFFCYVRVATESGCKLFAQKISSGEVLDLDLFTDYGAFEESFLPSLDGQNILVVYEKKGVLLNPETLEQKTIVEAPAGMTFGVYTGFPSFVPKVSWVDNTHIQFSLYPDGTMEDFIKDAQEQWVSGPTPAPSEMLTIDVFATTTSQTPDVLMEILDAQGDSTHFFKNSNSVWIAGEMPPDPILIPGADPKTFVPVGHPYSKDARAAYYWTFAIPGADPSTFETVNGPSNAVDAQDKNHKYLRGGIVE